MDLARDILVVVHLLGMALIVGGWVATIRTPRILDPVVWGARIQIITGVLLVGLLENDDTVEVNNAKIGLKLLIALVVVALAEANRKKGTDVKPGIFHAVGGLAVLNVLIAVLWS